MFNMINRINGKYKTWKALETWAAIIRIACVCLHIIVNPFLSNDCTDCSTSGDGFEGIFI